MKHTYLVGNWKSNKTEKEAIQWLEAFSHQLSAISYQTTGQTIILCVPYTLLHTCKHYSDEHSLRISLGAQDVSPYPSGSYTGEVNARQLAEFASYVMIGHSERRRHFHESDEELARKVERAVEENLRVIYCVRSNQDPIPRGVTMLLYEPVSAIGSGDAQNPKSAEKECAAIHAGIDVPIIYGGSVTQQNVASFMAHEHIWGVGVGKASLDVDTFMSIAQQV